MSWNWMADAYELISRSGRPSDVIVLGRRRDIEQLASAARQWGFGAKLVMFGLLLTAFAVAVSDQEHALLNHCVAFLTLMIGAGQIERAQDCMREVEARLLG